MSGGDKKPTYVLDTCVLFDILHRDKKRSAYEIARKIFDLVVEDRAKLLISIASLTEVYHLNPEGGNRPTSPEHVQAINGLFDMAEFEPVGIDLDLCRMAQRLRMTFPGFGSIDSIIVATCLTSDADAVITSDGCGERNKGIIRNLDGKEFEGKIIRAHMPSHVASLFKRQTQF